MRTSVPTTEPSPASGGRRRTNPFSCSRARPTTSRWESRTSSSRKSATRLLAVSSTPRPRTPSTSRRPSTPTRRHSNPAVISDIEAFADFMRMLAPPTPAPATPSSEKGRDPFAKIGCVHCHTPSFTTGVMIASGSATSPSAALSNQTANLFSDLLVHHMGTVGDGPNP